LYCVVFVCCNFSLPGAEIDFTATVSESVKVGAKITVTLNTGATVELVAATEGVTLTGSYTVEAYQQGQ
jgi:molybdenum cofactor biosynthesis enzyme